MATTHSISGGKHRISGSPIKALQTSVGNLSAQQGSVDMKSLLSLLDARYLRKIIEDTSYNSIYFRNSSVNAKDFKTIGARSGNVTGVGALITTNADGTAKMEIDELAVRRIMYVNELIIAQATHTGGVNLTSAANAVIADFTFVSYDDDSCPTDILDLINYSLEDDEKLDGVWRCRFDNQNNNLTNLYKVGDVALAQTFNYDPSGSYEMKYYRRRVLGIGMNYIDLELGGIALAGVEGSNIANGDNACQWGHLWDRKRQSVVEINTLEGGRQSFFQKMGDCRDVLTEERREVDYEDMTLDEKRAIWGSDLWYDDTDKNVLDMGYLYTNVFGDAEWRNAIIIKGDFAAITKDGKQGFKVNNKTGEVEVACKKFSVLSEFKTYDESWFVGADNKVVEIEAKADAAQGTADQVASDLATYEDIANDRLDAAELGIQDAKDLAEAAQASADKAVEVFEGDYTPTLTNFPASGWTDTDTKDKHVNDLFDKAITSDGVTTFERYRFSKVGTTYSWKQIADSGSAAAMAEARNALGIANSKNKTVYSSGLPPTPYSVNDFWIDISDYDTMYICTTARASGSGASSDWGVINNAMLQAANRASDLKVTDEEKLAYRDDATQMQKELATYTADATTYGVSITALTNAYNAVVSVYNNVFMIEDSGTTTITEAQRTDYNTKLATYQSEKIKFANAISEVIAQGKVDAIEFSGVNLLDGSAAEFSLGSSNFWKLYKIDASKIEAGAQYTVSFETVGDILTTGYIFIQLSTTNNNIGRIAHADINDTDKVYTLTVSDSYTPSDTVYFQFGNNGLGGDGTFYNVMLVKGNKIDGSWSPSINDTNEAIQAAQDTADTVTLAVAAINDDGIFSIDEKLTTRAAWEKISGLANVTHTPLTAGALGSYMIAKTAAEAVSIDTDDLSDKYQALLTMFSASNLNLYGAVNTNFTTTYSRMAYSNALRDYANTEEAVLSALADLKVSVVDGKIALMQVEGGISAEWIDTHGLILRELKTDDTISLQSISIDANGMRSTDNIGQKGFAVTGKSAGELKDVVLYADRPWLETNTINETFSYRFADSYGSQYLLGVDTVLLGHYELPYSDYKLQITIPGIKLSMVSTYGVDESGWGVVPPPIDYRIEVFINSERVYIDTIYEQAFEWNESYDGLFEVPSIENISVSSLTGDITIRVTTALNLNNNSAVATADAGSVNVHLVVGGDIEDSSGTPPLLHVFNNGMAGLVDKEKFLRIDLSDDVNRPIIEARDGDYELEMVDSYVSSDGLSGYRKWSGGIMEVWGYEPADSGTGTVNLSLDGDIAFINTSYNVTLTIQVDVAVTAAHTAVVDTTTAKTTTSFHYRKRYAGASTSGYTGYEMYWRAIGLWKTI